MSEAQMLIIGAGECGTRAAFALRELGFDGSITLLGAEPTFPYERPPLSKQFLVERDAAQTESVPYIATAERFATANIHYLAAYEAKSLACSTRQVIATNQQGQHLSIHYDKLLLATGTVARHLPNVPQHEACCYLRTLSDARHIYQRLQTARRLLIVGGGLIGMELAASARKLGIEVTVLEAGLTVLSRAVPPRFAAMLAERHQQEGVTIHCNAKLATVNADENGVTAILNNGALFQADLLVVSVGVVANQSLAEKAGLTVANGIVVNEQLRSSDPHIFAAGDCCCFPCPLWDGELLRLETWRNAQSQGYLAAQNMLGQQQTLSDIPWFWSDQYDLGLQVAGLSQPHHHTVSRTLKNGAIIQFELNATGQLMAVGALGQGNSVAKDVRLAEMLIAKGIHPDPAQLADATLNLKKLLN